MGLITQAVNRALPIQRARATSSLQTSDGTMATASGINALRRVGPQGTALYRNWAMHGELVRAALDIKLGQLAEAEWDLVPFDNEGRPPDQGLMNRQREILMQPNPGESSLGTFLQSVGEDLFTLDAGPFEKERLIRGELIWLWPVDGDHIKIDRFWSGDPRSPRYYYTPRPEVAVPLLNMDIGYLKMHNRSYSPLGIPPLETLKNAIDAELSGSLYNTRQVTQAAPDGIMDLGENARPDQVETFKALWNTLIAGKSMMAFWGGTKSAKFIPFKANQKDMQFIEWQEYCVRKICAVLHLSPQDLGFSFDINKSTGEVQQAQTDDKGGFHLSRVQDIMTAQFCWDPYWGGPSNNIAFRFRAVSDRQSKNLAETQKLTLAGMPSETVNEARKRQGKKPIGDPNSDANPFNKLMANTPQGLVLLDDIPTARELAMRKVPKPGEANSDAPKQLKAIVDHLENNDSSLEVLRKAHDDLTRLLTSSDRSITVTTPVSIDHFDPESSGHIKDGIEELRDAVKALPAPIVNIEAAAPPDVHVENPPVDMQPVADAILQLKSAMDRPTPQVFMKRREVIRDQSGRITDVIEHLEEQ